MAQYFCEFRDLTSDHENIPHKISIVVGVAMCYVSQHASNSLWWLASTCTYVRVRTKCSGDSLLKMSLYAYFQKTSKSCLPNLQGPLSKQLPSCTESANNPTLKS